MKEKLKLNKKKIIIISSIVLAAALLTVLGILLIVKSRNTGGSGNNTGLSESVTYYYSHGDTECELLLRDDGSFILTYNSKSDEGSFSLSGSALTLDFATDGKESIEAVYENEMVSLTYGGASMRMLKKVYYTVKFEAGEGTAVSDVSVLNGKGVAKPADPERSGYIFVGWYKDSRFESPFTFSSDIVSGDVTLYARWVERSADGNEYNITFNLAYEGCEAPMSVPTVGARLFGAPTPTRVGFEFCGWWFSTDNDPARPSYVCTEETVFSADTTLFALWLPEGSTRLLPPSLKVSESGIAWDSVKGARSYDVTVTDSEGRILLSSSTGVTSASIAFSDYPEGIYSIKVVANSNTGSADNSEAYYTLANKALDKVDKIFVSGNSMLVFEGVEGAEKYLITVKCGNYDHRHTDFDNGESKTFSFVNCPMTKEGISFVIKAVAEGYLSSVSDEFVYRKDLSAVSGLVYNDDNGTVSWDTVESAEYYIVSVSCGNSTHSHSLVNVGSELSFDIKECESKQSGITVKVYPVADGYASPEPSSLTVNKTALGTPGGIALRNSLISWERNPSAEGYEISVNGVVYSTDQNSFDLSSAADSGVGTVYTILTPAKGAEDSLWSEPITVANDSIDGISYFGNTLSWNHVLGADFYEIRINNGEITRVENGVPKIKISLSVAGVNVIEVRFADVDFRSEWASISVHASSVTFDTLGGGSVNTVYYAPGDEISLPVAERTGYDFVSWYNVPGGPEALGKEITGGIFKGTDNVVLYAHYTPKKYEITYNYGIGGTGAGLREEVYFGSNYTLEIPTATDSATSFGGWFSEPYGNGIQYTDASGKGLSPWSVPEDKELYAFWIDETLEFELVKVNGRDVYSVSAGARISLVSAVTVPAYIGKIPVGMVDGNAFKDCKNLKEISLPSTIELISSLDPFEGCYGLTDINVYSVDGTGVSRYESSDGVLIERKQDGSCVILAVPRGRTGIYRIPDGISEIPAGAFSESLLDGIIIPTCVSKIGNDAFASSKNLRSVEFIDPTAVDAVPELTIGKRAFGGCTALVSIELPARLTSIELSKYFTDASGNISLVGDDAFAGCTSLTAITVASGSASYGITDGMIYSADRRHLLYCPTSYSGAMRIPIGTQSIGAGAFIGCGGLTEIVIPNTVTYVGEYAFYSLALASVTFSGNGLNDVTVGDNSFRGCADLETVVFEQGSRIAVIGESAFADCRSISEFSIPATVSSIRSKAFMNCLSLANVTFAANGRALEFGTDVFYNCAALTTVTIPANVSKIPGIFGGCTSLEEVKVDSASQYFTSVDGVIFNKKMTEIIYFPQGKGGNYTIPEGVTSIANGVFSENKTLTELVIPNSVSYIGEEAFRGTRIGKIIFSGDIYAESLTIGKAAFKDAYFENYDFILPSHTKEIGEYAFSGVYYRNIILNEGIEVLGDYAFYFPNGTGGGTVNIPASVRTIGKYCFSGDSYLVGTSDYGCYVNVTFTKENSCLTEIGDFAFYKNSRLTAAELPDSVRTIGNYAFYECRSLATVKLSESLEVIGAYAFAASSYTYRLLISELTIPKNVREIGAHAFEHCHSLTSVTFEGAVDSPDLYLGTTYLRSYTSDGVEMHAIERGNVFASCNRLLTVALSPNVIALGDYCFVDAGDAGFEVTVPESSRLASIGAYCFYNSRLVAFTVPATVRNLSPLEEYGVIFNRPGIGEYAFAASTGYLTEITFLKDNNAYPLTIGSGAFSGQSALESIELPARLKAYATANGEVIAPLADGPLVFAGANALAAITVEQGSLIYTVYGGILYTADMKELVFCPASVMGEVIVPATVTQIHSYAFYGCKSVTELKFKGGTESMTIGDYAFCGMSGITKVVLPSSVISLGEGAFYGCSSLETVTLSKHLQSFDIFALQGCGALKNILVESGNPNYTSLGGVLYNATKTVLILYPIGRTESVYTLPEGVVTIDEYAFSGNTSLLGVVLPAGLREIKDGAFEGCTALESVTIPNSVGLIGDRAFANASAIGTLTFEIGGSEKLVIGSGAFMNIGAASLILPARLSVIGSDAFLGAAISSLGFETADRYQLTEIGDNAFRGTTLSSVRLPAGVTVIGKAAFGEISTLAEIIFGEGLTEIGDEAFSSSSLKSVYLPQSLKVIGAKAFYECKSLMSVIFADNSELEIIGAGAFSGCISLKSIELPAYLTEIGGESNNGAFLGCVALESVIFKSNLNCKLIGDYAFSGCTSLSYFSLPGSVGELGDYAFFGCTSLKEITIPLTTTKLGKSLFEGCTSLATVDLNSGASVLPENLFKGCSSLKYICIPKSVNEIGRNCFAGTAIESFEVEEGSMSFVAISGLMYNISKTEILHFPPNSTTTTLFIPKEIVSIPDSNFAGCTNIKEVIFEEGGTTPLAIGEKAFLGCYQLRRLVLPERLVSIGKYAFKECYALTSVNIPKNVTEIGDFAFTWCYKLYEVYNESAITNIGSKGSIKTAQPNVNIYTPTSGSSVLFREGDFLFATVKGVKTLIGYEGNEKDITLPTGKYSIADYLFYNDTSVTSVTIPDTEGITLSVSQAFSGCKSLVKIFLADSSVPSSWSSRWHSGMSVVYGYTGSEITYTFNTNGGDSIAPITSNGVVTLPVPNRENYVFTGWFDNEALEGAPIADSQYYSSEATVLYAGWIHVHERFGGKSPEDAFGVTDAVDRKIYIDAGDEKIYFRIEVTEDTKYSISVTPIDNVDPVIYIYNADGEQIARFDNGKAESEAYTFTANEGSTVYYIGIGYYSTKSTGTSTVQISVMSGEA